jgi:hypothetical protein
MSDMSDEKFRLLRSMDSNDVWDNLTPIERTVFTNVINELIVNAIIHGDELEKPLNHNEYMVSNIPLLTSLGNTLLHHC